MCVCVCVSISVGVGVRWGKGQGSRSQTSSSQDQFILLKIIEEFYGLCPWLIYLAPNVGIAKLCCRCSVAKSCPILCNPMGGSRPGSPVHHCLLEFTQIQGGC